MVVMRPKCRALLSLILIAVLGQSTLGNWHSVQAQESTDSEVPAQPGTPDNPQVYIFSETYSVTDPGQIHSKKDKKRRGKARNGKHKKGNVRSEERYRVKKNNVVVWLEPQLEISDYGAWEDVRGRVYSYTGAPARDVNRMDIGGALLQGNTCDDVYADPTPLATNQVFTKTHYGYSPWTRWERGTNDCWRQTGHNYFRIRVSKGEIWVRDFWGDSERDM